jgi:small-conductance mechanosensitive channel
MTAAATRGVPVNLDNYRDLIYIGVGIIVFVLFIFLARVIAHFAGEQLRRRQVRSDMVVLGRRVVTGVVIVLGIFAALGIAAQTANVTLFGLLLATIVAALGVQDLLRDYVSGYYVLWEHHIRVGDNIEFDGHGGVVTDVRLRVTLLKSENGDVIVVPNSEMFTKPVTIHGVTPAQEEARKELPK